MGLRKYNSKRKFNKTPEPEGKSESKKADKKLSFVIQRHDATNLHYDLRLEMEGVLKSWAVPKGPSMNPKDKRLAMHVEDHPFEYGKFEGEIPEGNYGAGLVEIWDKGTLAPIEMEKGQDPNKVLLKQLKEGSLKFKLMGRKVKGEFALVKTKGMGENSWLLIKHRDKYAVDDKYNAEDNISKRSKIPKGGRKAAKKEKSYPKFKPLKKVKSEK